MQLNERLQLLRNENGMSQEELAEKLGISRQAISKWESGQSVPDLKKLISIAELYNITIDSLVRDNEEYYNEIKEEKKRENVTNIVINLNREYEYKSSKTICGIPLVHINIGNRFKKAKGIVAIGNISYGVISIGLISLGVINIGILSLGLVSLGILSIALLLAIGAISLGFFAFGAISIGIFSAGAIAIGKFSAGALSIASDIAIGDYATGKIAIGNTVKGAIKLPLDTPIKDVESIIKQEYLNLNPFFTRVIEIIIGFIK